MSKVPNGSPKKPKKAASLCRVLGQACRLLTSLMLNVPSFNHSELIPSLQAWLHFPTQALLSTSDPFSGSVPLSFLPHAWGRLLSGSVFWIIPVITACLPACGPPAEVT